MSSAFTTDLAQSITDLQHILLLQQQNLVKNISADVRQREGFVTVEHNLDLLQKMNDAAPQVIARAQNRVVGYALTMLDAFKDMIPVLTPMCNLFRQIDYRGKKVSDYPFYIMGQVCVAEDFRGQGVFEQLYQKHRDTYSGQYDLLLTEISTSNARSMRAHQKVGFQTIHTFRDATDEWNIVVWDWRP